MKIAISGKGGVGKTTLAALLAHYWANQGREVIAVDADPVATLASALGIPADQVPTPISEMQELIEERTESKKGYGTYFKLNPHVEDIPDTYCARLGRIRLLVLGGVTTGGSGCICPESALLKALVTHLLLGRRDIVILDMEAGIEHLGRATAEAVSLMIVVVDPGQRSQSTAQTIRRLCDDVGIPHVVAVVNKFPAGMPLSAIEKSLDGIPILGVIPYDEAIMKADIDNRTIFTGDPAQLQLLAPLVAKIETFEK
jgi:CO dehydrogenase maturation factor